MVPEQREYRFPEGFLWGSSTSGPQSEGSVAGDGKGGITGIMGNLRRRAVRHCQKYPGKLWQYRMVGN
ncbi:family 1 glycosylhydrolase [Streptococcus suis]|uniref:family 1 glycosylhydrolase n=1 Tax=Streptococcus suis TaxID=1307 RepID=UPI001583B296